MKPRHPPFLALIGVFTVFLAVSAVSAMAAETPFKGTVNAHETVVPSPPTASLTRDGTGTATYLGRYTEHIVMTINLPTLSSAGTATFTAANGDALTADDVQGTILEKPEYLKAYSEMVVDSKPSFFIEHLERLGKAGIQPHFMLGHVAQLETVERLIRKGQYRGPLILNYVAIGGGAAGLHPADMIEFARRHLPVAA